MTSQLSSLCVSVAKALTGGLLDLYAFEEALHDHRDPDRPPNLAVLEFTSEGLVCRTGAEQPRSEVKTLKSLDGFTQEHVITQPFSLVQQTRNGRFNGYLLRKEPGKRGGPQLVGRSGMSKNLSTISVGDAAEYISENAVLVNLASIKALYLARQHFGLVNFINIFRLFYTLSNIPPDAENNPLRIFMD